MGCGAGNLTARGRFLPVGTAFQNSKDGGTKELRLRTSTIRDDEDSPPQQIVVVRDAGATLTPHGRCRALDPHAVHCRIRDELLVAQVALGDGNDRVSFPPSAADASATLAGGAGDDEITGIGTLKGGPGDPTVTCRVYAPVLGQASRTR